MNTEAVRYLTRELAYLKLRKDSLRSEVPTTDKGAWEQQMILKELDAHIRRTKARIRRFDPDTPSFFGGGMGGGAECPLSR